MNKTKDYNELELVFPTEEYKSQVEEFLKEFVDNREEKIHGAGGLDKINDFDKWLQKVRNDLSDETVDAQRVPASMYLAIRKSDKRIVGIIQIRHYLNQHLLDQGGHIGDSVRPSERKKGYATEMIRLALEKCKDLKINKVLMVCYKDNIASKKSIINNGGIFENEIQRDGKTIQRFWINN